MSGTANPYDQFDAPAANPYDQFDNIPLPPPAPPGKPMSSRFQSALRNSLTTDNIAKSIAGLRAGFRSGTGGNLWDMPVSDLLTGDTNWNANWDRNIAQSKAEMQAAPIASTIGQIQGAVGNGILASPATGFTPAATPGVGPAVKAVGSYLGRNAGLGAGLGAMEGNGLEERATNAALGGGIGALAAGLTSGVGMIGQGIINTGRSGINAVRQIVTPGGREGIAGQVLREASGDYVGPTATSNITPLRTAQVTGNPGIASLERTLAPEGSGIATHVQGGRTADQTRAVLERLPGYAEGNPAGLLADNSRAGVSAIQRAEGVLDDYARGLWSAPELTAVPLVGSELRAAGNRVIDRMPAGLRATFDSAEGAPLRPFRQEIAELGDNPSIADVNAIVSRLRKASRDFAAGANPNGAASEAARRAANGLIDAIGDNPTIAGRAAVPANPGKLVEARTSGEMVREGATPAIPAIPANPEALSAFRTAREATRVQHELLGYNEFNNVLAPNNQGNVQADASGAFGRFFQGNGGEGAYRLSNLAGRLRGLGTEEGNAAADALKQAAQNHVGLSVLRSGRPIDNLGSTSANLGAIERTAGEALPSVRRNPMMRDIEPALQDVQEASAALMRPSRSRGDTNSTTFEKLQKNQMISAILGQSGASGLAGPAGAAAAYYGGPDSIPAPARLAAGFAAGVGGGRMLGPAVADTMASTPLLRSLTTGPTEAVKRNLERALADPAVYRKLMSEMLLAMPSFGAPGAVSGAGNMLAPIVTPLAIQQSR